MSNVLTYKQAVVQTKGEFRAIVANALRKGSERGHIEIVAADGAPDFANWRLTPDRSIGCYFITMYEPNVFYDRTIGMSAWRFLRQDMDIDFGVIPIDMNEALRQSRQYADIHHLLYDFKDDLKDAYGWNRMSRSERRNLKRSFFDLHRRAIAIPAPVSICNEIWERILDITDGVYAGEVSTMDAQWRRYMKK